MEKVIPSKVYFDLTKKHCFDGVVFILSYLSYSHDYNIDCACYVANKDQSSY